MNGFMKCVRCPNLYSHLSATCRIYLFLSSVFIPVLFILRCTNQVKLQHVSGQVAENMFSPLIREAVLRFGVNGEEEWSQHRSLLHPSCEQPAQFPHLENSLFASSFI